MAFEKAPTVAKHKAHENDTGSTRVQVALLTERINYLNDHIFVRTPRTITAAVGC